MPKLASIFSSHALYQQQSVVTLRGTSRPNAIINAVLTHTETGKFFDRGQTEANDKGAFCIKLQTPSASFEIWEIRVNDGEEILLEDILFGELWLAGGQSNMSMENQLMTEADAIFETVRKRYIRFYNQNSLWDRVSGLFTYTPLEDFPGQWHRSDDRAGFDAVSACATVIAQTVYDHLNVGNADIPVGFVNCNMGAIYIEGWLPAESFHNDSLLYANLEEKGQTPLKERWDSYGEVNYLQPCAMYNTKTAPLRGIRLRGMLWYQGEGNTRGRAESRYYRRALEEVQRVYETLFRIDATTRLPIICAQLFPNRHGQSGECLIGYINEAFTDMAVRYPDIFSVVPTYDLSPYWLCYDANHPVHPINKYSLGVRMGQIALALVYRGDGPRTAASLKNWERAGNLLRLTFHIGNYSLQCHDGDPQGFYICGKDGVYVAAKAVLESCDTITLSHPFIPEPQEAAYQYGDMQFGGNILCGGLPLAPFSTQLEGNVVIEAKPWLNLTQEAVWTAYDMTPPNIDCFYRPTWQPIPDSAICRDDVFCIGDKSLRILGSDNEVGAFVESYPCNALDLYRYRALRFQLFDDGQSNVAIRILYPEMQEAICLQVVQLGECQNGWTTWETQFNELPPVTAARLELKFDVSKKLIKAVNIDGMTLIPAQA